MNQRASASSSATGARVDRLESFAVAAVAWFSAGLLVLGAALPYLPASGTPQELEGEATGDRLDSLFLAGWQLVGWRDADGDGSAGSVIMGIGYLGLMAVTALALFSMYLMATEAGEFTQRWASACAVLMTIGLVVAALLMLMAATSDDGRHFETGPGPWCYAAGLALYWALVGSATLREWWDPTLGTGRARAGVSDGWR